MISCIILLNGDYAGSSPPAILSQVVSSQKVHWRDLRCIPNGREDLMIIQRSIVSTEAYWRVKIRKSFFFIHSPQNIENS